MRREAAEQSKRIYGEDSHEYRQARAAMVDAEMALQRAVRTTKNRWEEMIGISDTSRRAGSKLAATLNEVGKAGADAGDEAAAGLHKIGSAASTAKGKVDALNRSLVNSKDGGGTSTEGGTITGGNSTRSVAQWFGDQWSSITKGMQGFKSLDELAQYENKYRKEIYHRTAKGSWMSDALRKHTADAVPKPLPPWQPSRPSRSKPPAPSPRRPRALRAPSRCSSRRPMGARCPVNSAITMPGGCSMCCVNPGR
jgi:hypothetical protein